MATEAKTEATKPDSKMTVEVGDDGSLTYKFNGDFPANEDGTPGGAIPDLHYKLEDFPANVQKFYAHFGMKTKLRNFTIPDKGEKDPSAATMYAQLSRGAGFLKEGLLRVAREAGEKKAGGSLLLEAAILYKKIVADTLGVPFKLTDTQVAAELEALSEKKLEELRATTTFKLAMSRAKKAREAARESALEEQVRKELLAAQKAAEEEANSPTVDDSEPGSIQEAA